MIGLMVTSMITIFWVKGSIPIGVIPRKGLLLGKHIDASPRMICHERSRLKHAAFYSAEKVTGLKRNVDEISGELVSAREDDKC